MSSLQEQLAKLHSSSPQSADEDDASTLGAVRSILAKVTGAEPENIGADSQLRNDLGVGSLDVIEIAVRVEQKFGKKVDHDEGFQDFRTVADIVNFVDS